MAGEGRPKVNSNLIQARVPPLRPYGGREGFFVIPLSVLDYMPLGLKTMVCDKKCENIANIPILLI